MTESVGSLLKVLDKDESVCWFVLALVDGVG